MNALRFFRAVHGDNVRRFDRRRALARDLLLYARNRALRPLEVALARRYYDERQPIVFIVGAPRSGTTLLSQLIARSLQVAWVNNFVARYWMAPIVGMRRYRARCAGRRPEIPLESWLGGTEGSASPHEFGWFWQHFAPFGDSDELTPSELAAIDWDPLVRELYGMAGFARRPLVQKSITQVDYQIGFLARRLPNVRFVHIRRDPLYVVQSILEARAARYGSEREWWSLRPREWRRWTSLEPIEQVCRQVMHARDAIDAQLAGPARGCGMALDYERLVAAPREAIAELGRFIGSGPPTDSVLDGVALVSGNRRGRDPERMDAIAAALEARKS